MILVSRIVLKMLVTYKAVYFEAYQQLPAGAGSR